jgi:hypothetical protein
MEFNHEHLRLVKENEQTSEHDSDYHCSIDREERERVLIELNGKIAVLTSENI